MATHNLDILKKYPKNRVIALEKGQLLLNQNQKKEKTLASDPDFQQITGFTVVAQQEKKEHTKEEKK
jgi:hypothetical protein